MTLGMHIPSLIERKRNGGSLSQGEIDHIIQEFTQESLPDYQMSALAMAIYFQGMSAEETAWLTRAMLMSGERFDWPTGHPLIVDKHSTGGIGDKVSLILAPLLACAGVWVPMISGRGLGITGGTLDKLEAVPGFNVRLSMAQAQAQLAEIGVVMMGQTERLCPADKKLYALRDVTATVPSQPLIVASIMSKKLAEGLDRLVLDVKFGSGAFMKTKAEAESLAAAMVSVGEANGVATIARLNPMNEPLGCAVGNALEVQECLDVMAGKGPQDLVKVTLELAKALVPEVSASQWTAWLIDGSAMKKWEALCSAQNGDMEAFHRRSQAPVILEVKSSASGQLIRLDAEEMGRAALALGAGRAKTKDEIDPRVGFDQIAKVGESIQAGDVLYRIHSKSEADAQMAKQSINPLVE